jgi:excinuclease ABC subunit C
MEKFRIISKNNIDKLPQTAGVYAFYPQIGKSSDLLPIYIGKAIDIKKRVKNHFNGSAWWEKTLLRQGFAGQVGFIETGSEISALILEANLIKKFQPKFNVAWKDDKNYFYVEIARNKQKIPYIYITHQLQTTHYLLLTKHIGPFVDGNALKKTLRFLRKAFPFYSSSKHSKLKCQYCHLDLCPGPNPNLQTYKKDIKKIILVLRGKSKSVLSSLKKEMAFASKEQNFEKAGKLRDQIFALEKIISHAKICKIPDISPKYSGLEKLLDIKRPIRKIEAYDVSNIQGEFATASMVVFINGGPEKNLYRKFKIRLPQKPNDIAMLKEVLQRRFSHSEWPLPEIILIDGGRAQLNAALEIVKLNNLLKIKNCKLKILAIAKGRQELFIENKKEPIPLKNLPQEIYNLIKNLDAEAHRFAINYHKKLRQKNLLQ